MRIRVPVGSGGIPNEAHRLVATQAKRNSGNSIVPTFEAMFVRQFEATAVHNHWTPREKVAHIQVFVQGQATDILHSILATT